MNFCPNCGKVIIGWEEFCANCGSPLSQKINKEQELIKYFNEQIEYWSNLLNERAEIWAKEYVKYHKSMETAESIYRVIQVVCPICGPRHDKEITDGMYPPACPRCRCWVNHEPEFMRHPER